MALEVSMEQRRVLLLMGWKFPAPVHWHSKKEKSRKRYHEDNTMDMATLLDRFFLLWRCGAVVLTPAAAHGRGNEFEKGVSRDTQKMYENTLVVIRDLRNQ